jgi:SAM-dependent methyltransferase
MLKSQLLTESLVSYHQDFIDHYGDRFGDLAKIKKSEERKKLATLHLFGYQWTTFVENFSYFKEIFLGFVRPFLAPEDFRGKLVLEVGCGSGRPASVAASFGAEVVGIDLSEAVQTAYSLSKHYPLLHVVQGDAYALPFKPCFDFVYSVGVIQHVPDPPAVLMSISRVVAPGRRLIIWVYGVREIWYQPIDWLRKLTVKLPFTMLRVLSYLLAVLTEITLLMPYRILSRIPVLEKVAKKIPGRIYANFPFRENVVGWFDRLGAPVTYYFSREDVEDMLNKADFECIEVVARPDASASWVASAVRKATS